MPCLQPAVHVWFSDYVGAWGEGGRWGLEEKRGAGKGVAPLESESGSQHIKFDFVVGNQDQTIGV